MKINVQEILNGPLYVDAQRSPKDIDTGDLGFSLKEPITANLVFKRTKTDILCKGEMKGDILLECSRCVEEFKFSVTSPVEVRFLPRSNLMGNAYLDVAEKDLNISYYDGETIDLDEHIRENIILLIPMKPLCISDCKGLCSQCGVNLNQEECLCEPVEQVDPRFAQLKNLFEKG